MPLRGPDELTATYIAPPAVKAGPHGKIGCVEKRRIIAAADGSAIGNPGPAGWGWYIDDARWAAGGWPHGTNNQGELTAVLDLLRQALHLDDDLVVYCDSQYVINSITKWMAGWKRKGWRKADGKPVKNAEIMVALDECMTSFRAAGREVEFRWVKGHAGHELNEAADDLANGAAMAYQRGEVPEAGPGIPGATTFAATGGGHPISGTDGRDSADSRRRAADAEPDSLF